LVGIGAAIGIPAALVAVLFLALVHVLEKWLWSDLPDYLGRDEPPVALVVLLPVVGAFIVFSARAFLPGDGGHSPLHGIGLGPVPVRHAAGIVLAALGTLPFGAVLGPEAPLIALGSTVGMAAAGLARLDSRGERVISTAGSFSAISALFGGPLVAGMLLLEAGLSVGAALLPLLVPGLVAAGVGYLVFIGVGSWAGVDAATLSVAGLPEYQETQVLDLVLAVVVGILAALVVVPAWSLGRRIAALVTDRRRMLPVLVLGGAAVGGVAAVGRALGADSQDVLFSGQASVLAVTQASAPVLLVLLVAKSLGYAISLGSGFRGGPVFPAIFLGTVIACFAVVFLDVSPTWAVAVGAAAGTAAATRLLFSSVLLAALLVGSGSLDVVPAAILAATAAWLTKAVVDPPAAPAVGRDDQAGDPNAGVPPPTGGSSPAPSRRSSTG
jgi:H+/Cl- antiporter ClcA